MLRLLLPLLLAATVAQADARPNIVFIMSDDQGPWAWGYGGHPDARTPNLDRLREQGANLPQYFNCAPVCSPSRAGTLASLYPTQTGIIDYLSPSRPEELGLDPDLPTWPKLLQAAGYRSGMFGKWHVGRSNEHLPTNNGYDTFVGWRQGAGISINPPTEIDGEERVLPGYSPDVITDHAIDFIEQNRQWPFLVSLHFFAPHANTDNRTLDDDRTWLPVSQEDWEPFKDLEPTLPEPRHPLLDVPRANRMTREYMASVAAVDRNVGRVMAALDEMNLAENTLMVFTSDHGFNIGHHGIWHKGNGRWLLTEDRTNRQNLWDNSVKAPAIVRWPKAVKSGSTVTHTVSNLDWFPTLLTAAGVTMPADAEIEGHDFLPLLRGEKIAWNEDFFAQHNQWPDRNSNTNMRMYRTPKWKIIRDFTRSGKDELYHLAEDPLELTNLIESEDAAVLAAKQDLDNKMLAFMARIGDPSLPG
jgi:uncharacterized sulfatase